jgi:putative hydroxymethylpyrimidine transporter CytX
VALPALRRPPEWGVEPVPPEKRSLRGGDLFALWASLGVGLLVLAAGDWLVNGFGLNLAEVLAVSVAGSVVGGALLAAAARPGVAHGVPTMVSLRPIVGLRGSFLPSALNALQLLGWATFEVFIMAYAAAQLTGLPFGPSSTLAFVPLFGGVALVLALAGPLAVVRRWLRTFAVWGVIATTAYLAYALATRGLSLDARPGAFPFAGPVSLMAALDLVIVMPVSWWPLVADYNRFARSGRASWAGTVAGNALGNAAFFALGGALVVFGYAQAAPGASTYVDFLAGMAGLGLAGLPLFLILVDETDNAFANLYSTAVSVQNLKPRWRQAGLVAAATAAACVGAASLALTGQTIGGDYERFLILIGGVFVPLLGVVIADAWVVRRGGYRDAEFADGAPAFRWTALAAWAPGTALYLAIALQRLPGFPPIGATLPSFAVSAALHIALSRRPAARGRP